MSNYNFYEAEVLPRYLNVFNILYKSVLYYDLAGTEAGATFVSITIYLQADIESAPTRLQYISIFNHRVAREVLIIYF